jgi:CheY-like chemotaxis protein
MARKKRVKKEWTGHVAQELASSYGIAVPEQQGEKTLSPNQIGNMLGITGEAVKQWIYNRRLPAVKLSNGYWRVRVNDLERFIAERQTGGKRKIIVAGSDAQALAAVSSTLEALGDEPVIANNMFDATLKCHNLSPALIVIDVSTWPDGWTLAQRIRATQPLRNIPILFVTSEQLKPAQLDQAIALEIKGCIGKPIDAAILSREVNRVLARK